MAKERLGSPRARLFVALDLPDGVRAALADWQAAELNDKALRAVPAENLHVTACFLGWTAERRIPDAESALASIEPAPIEMCFLPEAVARPTRRPRLLAVEAPSDAAVALSREACDRFEAERLYRPEERDFWSHVTVARVRGRGKPEQVRTLPGPLPDALQEPFDCVRLTLYRSNLRSYGAEYVPLANIDLPPRPAGGTRKE